MGIATLGDLLDRASEFEARLEKYYGAVRDHTTDNGVRLLTYYLARHRRHQEQGLQAVVRLGRLMITNSSAEVSGQHLLETAVNYDTRLIALYREILKQPLTAEARAMIEALIRIEERDVIMLKKMIAMEYL